MISQRQNKKTNGLYNKLLIFLGAICCILFSFIVVLSIPVYLFRILVILLAKILRPDLDGVLNGLSSLLSNDYFHSKSPRGNVVLSIIIQGNDGPVEELKEKLMERWILAKNKTTGKPTFKQFQQYPERWLGFTFWKNCMDTFDINNHVYGHEEKDTVDDNDVNMLCEKLLNTPFKRHTSPWEVHGMRNYKTDKVSSPNSSNPNQTTAVIFFKIHHCLADGFSMMTALVEGFGEQDISKVKIPMPRFPKRNFVQKVFFVLSFPFRGFYEFSYAISHVFRQNAWKVPDEKKEWYQFCAKSDFIPIQKVKFIKSNLGVSFTSVLMSAISSAIDQNLQDAKWVNGATDNEDESMYCLCALPLPSRPKGLTNFATAAIFDLPFAKYDNSLERLKDVDFMLEESKNTCSPVFTPLYAAALGCHFHFISNILGKNRMVSTGKFF